MSVAVLIVNYRAYDDLERCLASLAPFVTAADEVVVVDQASDRAALRRAACALPSAQLIARDDNRGFAAGVNLAAAATTSPWLLLLNPDCVLHGDVLRTLERWLAAHPGTGVVGPRVVNLDGSLQPSARRFPGPSTALGGRTSWLSTKFPRNWFSQRNLLADRGDGPSDVDWVSGACLMTTREAFRRAGGLDESFFLFWEDADYCRRVVQSGLRCTYVPTSTVMHVGGTSAAHDRAGAIRAFHASAYRLYRKHGGPLAALVSPFVRAGLYARGEWRAWRAVREGGR